MQFHGDLTVDNIEAIYQMIFEKLDGKTYTFVAVNDGYNFPDQTEVRVDQQLNDPTPVYYGDGYAGFNFGDTYGVWGLSTSQRYDNDNYGEFNNPYIVIDWSKIKITHRAPAGHLLHWQIVLQD